MTAPLRRSLRRRFLLTALGGGVLAAATVAGVAVVSNRMRQALMAESRGIREEQRIADDIIGGVMRQLVTVSSAVEVADTAFRREFDAASAVVFEGLRTYLFRNLTPEQRLQIEAVKESHQQMEVSALTASRLARSDDRPAAAAARRETMRHGMTLLDALDGFVRLRVRDLEDLERRQASTFLWFWLAGGGAILVLGGVLVTLIGRFMQRQVAVPLTRMAEAASRIGGGALGTRVPTDHDLEFHNLATSFNRMAEQLEAAQASLASRNAELEQALQQVRAAQDELVQSEKLGAVGRMTAGLAHELNNPLASVLGFSELLAAEAREQRGLPADVAERYIEPIVREAKRARLLIRGLLQFSRRAGAEIGPVPLRQMLDVVEELRRHAFVKAGLSLVVEPVPEVAVMAEAQRLQSILVNIVNNALDAMLAKGRGTLRITTVVTGGTVCLAFADEGTGLAQPDRVFEPFYTTKDVGQGTGLGLSLAQRFAESFGGGIRAENRPEGGACITVRLPAAVMDPGPAATVPDAPVQAVPAPVTGAPTPVVLVVEDEAYLQRLSVQLLSRLGVRVLVAGTAAEARAHLSRGPVHAVVSDVKMPGESGIALHAWVAERDPALADRFLFVTGDIDTPELAAIAAERPNALLMKPFEVTEYLGRVREVLEGAGNDLPPAG